TLLIVNAKHDKGGIEFKACEGFPKDSFPVLLNVTVAPDPIKPGKDLTFSISGSVKDFDIPIGTYLHILFIPSSGYFESLDVDICSDTQCPIKAGTVYSTTQTVTVPKNLPPNYSIMVYEMVFAPDATIPYTCAIATIGS
ncbi:1736_t:CDS:1, partial [Acaulospora colombiana]